MTARLRGLISLWHMLVGVYCDVVCCRFNLFEQLVEVLRDPDKGTQMKPAQHGIS